jgi:hypothetical protein
MRLKNRTQLSPPPPSGGLFVCRPFIIRFKALYSSRLRKETMVINGHYNKPSGPGGGTRRLHQSPQIAAGFGGGEIGSTGV